MKFKTTQKAIKAGYSKVISISYCTFQHALNYYSPIAYTSNNQGWAADIYDFGNVAIVTGYSPFGNVKPDYNLIREYDKKAEEIRSRIFNYEELKKTLDKLIRAFIEEVTGETAA